MTKSRSRRRAWAPLVLLGVTTLFCGVVLEVGVRLLGDRPGFIPKYENFRPRPFDELVVKENFRTDEEGIFKANPDFAWAPEYRINADGFRGRALQPLTPEERASAKGVLLFLGDSFTWGADARPIDEGFVDIVERAGYVCFNTGIPGTDPSQYAVLAEKYVPLLKPSHVLTMFYIGNDFRKPRPMSPGKSLFHVTNLGWLSAFDHDGKHLSLREAYEVYSRRGNAATPVPDRRHWKTTVQRLAYRTALGTRLWAVASQLRRSLSTSGSASPEAKPRRPDEERYAHTLGFLHRIKAAAEREGATPRLFVIPDSPGLKESAARLSTARSLFADLEARFPEELSESLYEPPPNDHFNNAGHERYARFILEQLDAGGHASLDISLNSNDGKGSSDDTRAREDEAAE